LSISPHTAGAAASFDVGRPKQVPLLLALNTSRIAQSVGRSRFARAAHGQRPPTVRYVRASRADSALATRSCSAGGRHLSRPGVIGVAKGPRKLSKTEEMVDSYS